MGKPKADVWDGMMKPETRVVHGGEVYPSGPYVMRSNERVRCVTVEGRQYLQSRNRLHVSVWRYRCSSGQPARREERRASEPQHGASEGHEHGETT